MNPELPAEFPIAKRARPWNCGWSNPTCTRSAPCPRCRGRRNRQKGLRKQRTARKGLVPDPLWWSELANEENWRGMLRLEVKSGAQVRGIATKYLAAEAQADAARAVGDLRPFGFVAMPDEWGSEGLVVVRLSLMRALVAQALRGPEPESEGPTSCNTELDGPRP
jgi:hypothetical protein